MSLNKEIFRLSIPAIASNIIIPLLGICDTAITGHMGNASFIGAIAVGGMMLNTAFWLLGFLRMGTTGLVAQAYGKRDFQASQGLLSAGCLAALIISLIFIILRHPLSELLLYILSPEGTTRTLASTYFRICIMGSPALLLNMVISGWFLGMQDTLRPMYITIFVSTANICLSLFFVYAADMGFAGVAMWTLCANWVGLIFALALTFRFCKTKSIPSVFVSYRKAGRLKRLFTVNSDLFLRSACMMSVTMAMVAFGSDIGDATLSANAVMMQFFTLFSYFMDGFAFSAEALCGRFASEGALEKLKTCVKNLVRICGIMALILMLCYAAGFRTIISLITDNAAILKTASSFYGWIVALPAISVGAFLFDGVFIGLTATRKMLYATIAAAALFFGICCIPVAPDSFSLNARLWTAFLAYLAVRGIVLGSICPKLLKQPHSNLY